MQFTNIEEIGGRAPGIHRICLNFLIIWFLLWVFLILTLIFMGGRERRMDLLTKTHETNITERSSRRTNI